MSFASKYNRGSKFDIDTTNFQYISLEDLFKKNGEKATYTLRGLYINKKSKFGDAPVAILGDCFANLPNHMTDDVLSMLHDDEAIADIKASKVGFQIETYEAKNFANKICYGVRWVDL